MNQRGRKEGDRGVGLRDDWWSQKDDFLLHLICITLQSAGTHRRAHLAINARTLHVSLTGYWSVINTHRLLMSSCHQQHTLNAHTLSVQASYEVCNLVQMVLTITHTHTQSQEDYLRKMKCCTDNCSLKNSACVDGNTSHLVLQLLWVLSSGHGQPCFLSFFLFYFLYWSPKVQFISLLASSTGRSNRRVG